MNLLFGGSTHVGRVRTSNDDFLLIEPSLGLVVVCDGMGGHLAGEVAAMMAAHTVREVVSEKKELLEGLDRGTVRPDAIVGMLRRGVELASERIHADAARDRMKAGMGTTCTAAVLRAGRLFTAHVGDSRLYLIRQGQVTQLTHDHTVLAEAARRLALKPDGPSLGAFGNVLDRAVGIHSAVLVDVGMYELVTGDMVVLCTDGLHKYLPSIPDAQGIFTAASPNEACPAVIERANQLGGDDNLTVAVARVLEGDRSTGELMISDPIAKLTALRHISIFADLELADLMGLAPVFTEFRLAPGEVAIQEGDLSSCLYAVVEGAVEVLRGGRRIARLGPGTHFGEMALLSERPRTATVRVIEPALLLGMDRRGLYDYLHAHPTLAAKFFSSLAKELSRRLEDTQEQLFRHSQRPPHR